MNGLKRQYLIYFLKWCWVKIIITNHSLQRQGLPYCCKEYKSALLKFFLETGLGSHRSQLSLEEDGEAADTAQLLCANTEAAEGASLHLHIKQKSEAW